MRSYEIRLFDDSDSEMLTWKTVAAHTREARDKLEAVAHLAYARYEIWRDDLTLAEFADRSPQQS